MTAPVDPTPAAFLDSFRAHRLASRRNLLIIARRDYLRALRQWLIAGPPPHAMATEAHDMDAYVRHAIAEETRASARRAALIAAAGRDGEGAGDAAPCAGAAPCDVEPPGAFDGE